MGSEMCIRDRYYEIFTQESGEHLSYYVKTCLRFGKYGNASPQQQAISVNATEALRKIAKESAINKLRVSKFGIDV